jgi:hypothetical protein
MDTPLWPLCLIHRSETWKSCQETGFELRGLFLP